MNPATEQARQIDRLWWAMFVGAMVVFATVVFLLVLAFVRRRTAPSHDDRRPYMVVVGGGFVAPVVLLAILFGFVIDVMPAVSTPPAGSTRMTVVVIGHQYFWEFRYPGTGAITANELHLPANTPVEIAVRTADVIHSFWVPRLNRKIDMIPGRTNRIEIDAPTPGVYRGQCSEFCGEGHALMAFDVIVQPPAAFRQWLANQQQTPPAPSGVAAAGLQVFQSAGCGSCHMIAGTSAVGQVGPDLTHVGSRSTIAALTLPNTPQALYDWITDPQRYKPGARMPGFSSLPAGQRHSLVAYLESLR
ncbi:MAG TPA: cytochrome c oxidase subunit II [Gaiellales bacterium]|nr:cytochrome c oxidase subunit II [Gaiellales bacterium]